MKRQIIFVQMLGFFFSFYSLWGSPNNGDEARDKQFPPTAFYNHPTDQVGIFPVCRLPYPIGGFPVHRPPSGGNWEQNHAFYDPVGYWYMIYPRRGYFYSPPRNYTSRYFISEWKDQEPEICGDDLDSEICSSPMDFSESILLSEGMDQETVIGMLGSPLQKISLGEREIWKYSSYSLLFELGYLKEIR